jgi:hypothetical protein
MKQVLVFTVFVAAFFITAASASAQTRVNFGRGVTSTVLTGRLTNYKQRSVFLVRVRQGQTMTIRDLGPNAVSIWVEGPPKSGYEQDLAADCHGRTDVSPTPAGAYKLSVPAWPKVDRWRGTFKVRVTVR